MTDEIWKDIPGYEGLYKISSLGRVLSLRTGLFRKDVQSGRGYRAVQLSDNNGKKKRHYIHRLVAYAFLGTPPSPTCEVNHKDLDKTNNVVDNLEWCTPEENMHHAYLNGKTDYRRPIRNDNTTGQKGVSPCSGGYQVSICGKYIGWSKNLSSAIAMRKNAEKELSA